MINEDDEDFVVVSDKRPGGLSRAGLKRPHEEDNYAPADSPKECILSSKKTENMDIKSSIIAIVAEKDLEDDSNCPICLDRWTSSGEHRVASLRCGHLFGKQLVIHLSLFSMFLQDFKFFLSNIKKSCSIGLKSLVPLGDCNKLIN